MASDPIQDRFRQRTHAEETRQKRIEHQKSPEQQERESLVKAIVEALKPIVQTMVDNAVRGRFAGFTIQNQDDITISGSGENITIGRTPAVGPAGPLQPILAQPLYQPLLLCGEETPTWEFAVRPYSAPAP